MADRDEFAIQTDLDAALTEARSRANTATASCKRA